ncbi:hypothetical protein CDD80_1632 [Ophiocordyceps camponoti-rufipedis]|uniref:Cyanovirin-N domain-containing protein n=1 Tax=Ophiocordyceps camponoti-rufipedis TaxID=2004952 RepID=A0A2C5YQP1_9HYPO|nr:hypothetical protein CDD80_1632 [Ophiocordyceps camponoti-rufipedis]
MRINLLLILATLSHLTIALAHNRVLKVVRKCPHGKDCYETGIFYNDDEFVILGILNHSDCYHVTIGPFKKLCFSLDNETGNYQLDGKDIRCLKLEVKEPFTPARSDRPHSANHPGPGLVSPEPSG